MRNGDDRGKSGLRLGPPLTVSPRHNTVWCAEGAAASRQADARETRSTQATSVSRIVLVPAQDQGRSPDSHVSFPPFLPAEDRIVVDPFGGEREQPDSVETHIQS
ncbi:hypothetical protein JZ751_006035 [Albula glossodonta]|uniref:Uncharacterized protein n=1 Tax=Albula glossodonta TaxID=121402 RepID=A0A8T2PC83_9TELE|nr:hypothetical protein JZ751_006035 [Albula glossodonta]